MKQVNWDIVRFDAYKLLNNLNQVIEMNIDLEVEMLVKYLKEKYESNKQN